MRTTAAAVFMFVCLIPWAARAYDWSIRSTASETVSASDNLFLNVKPLSGFASYSTITANAEATTPTSKFDFDSYVNYNKYWGPAAAALTDTESLAFGFRGHYETHEKNSFDRNYLEAGFNQSSAAFALLGQLGVITNVKGAIDAWNFTGGIDRSLSALDTVSLSAHSTLTSYEPSSAGTAFSDTSTNASWSHRLSSLTTLTASSNAEWLAYDNVFGTNLLILRNQAGFETSFSPLLSFRGSWGAAYVQAENTGLATGSSSNIGFITDMLLTYKALKDTTFTLAGFQSVGPTAVGSLVETSSLRAAVNHIINSVSSWTIAADAAQTTTTTTSQYASASVSYSRALTREWSASITYRYLHSFGVTGATSSVVQVVGTPVISGLGAASSNTITVTVSKSTLVLPHT